MSVMKKARLAIGAVKVFLSVIGIYATFDEATSEKAAEEIASSDECSFVQPVDDFLKAFRKGNIYEKAVALISLIRNLYHCGRTFQRILQCLFRGMSTLQRIRTTVSVLATVASFFATGGAALIPKVILSLESAFEFVQMVRNCI